LNRATATYFLRKKGLIITYRPTDLGLFFNSRPRLIEAFLFLKTAYRGVLSLSGL